jgi:hypothetical protein
LVRQGHLKEFVLNKKPPAEAGPSNTALVQVTTQPPPDDACRFINSIYGANPTEGMTAREQKLYVNAARQGSYPPLVTVPPSAPLHPITFTDADAVGVRFPHNDALVITIQMGNCKMARVLIDIGSSVNIIYGEALDRMEETPEAARAMVRPSSTPLYGFDGTEARSSGSVSIPVRADPYNIITDFYVMDVPSPHNAILGRPWIHMMRAVPSTYHQLLRYPTKEGTADIRGDQLMSRTCAAVAKKKSGWTKKPPVTDDTEEPAKKKLKQIAEQ